MKAQQERFLIVRASDKRFAFPLKDIAEVMETFRTYPIPKAPPEYVGVMNSHGAPVPVLDFGSLLHGRPARQSGTILVIDSRIGSLALLVDGIEKIVSGCTAETGSGGDWLSGTSLELETETIPSPSLEKLVTLLEETLQGSGATSRNP
jgi:chemotaxis signal transduction protein